MESSKLRVIFLVGLDSPSTRQSVEAVCCLPGVEPVGLIVSDGSVHWDGRSEGPNGRIHQHGWSSTVVSILEAVASKTLALVNDAAISQTEVNRVLRQAFPERCFSMTDVARKYGMKLHPGGDSNSGDALQVLRQSGADLGVALGVRGIWGDAAAMLRDGCVTVREGIQTEGGKALPGFWEVYEGADSATVTARWIKGGSQRDEVIATSAVTMLAAETPDSLAEKLDVEASRVLATAVALIRDGEAVPLERSAEEDRVRREPTEQEVLQLQKRLPHWIRNGAVPTIVRNLYVLLVYYSGLYFVVREWHRRSSSRAAIVLYHRVNDYAKDVLTVDCRTFAGQLLAISRRYRMSSTAEMVECIRAGKPLQPTTVAIHFDDCYQDILVNGAPIMKACGVPACAFINSGFVDTDRTFAHDAASPYTFPMLRSGDVVRWTEMGFEVGAHTINHVDLGTYPVEDAGPEIVQCGVELERLIGKRVDLFAFPFGRPHHIRPATLEIIRSGGYVANFSANGGFIDSRTDPYDIPRGGAHYESSPVYCLLQIEGLTLSRLARKLRGAWKRPAQVAGART